MRYDWHCAHPQKHTDSLHLQPAGEVRVKKKEGSDRKRMTVLICSVIKSSANGVSINSVNAEASLLDLWEWVLKNRRNVQRACLRLRFRKSSTHLYVLCRGPHLVYWVLIVHIFNALIIPQQLCTVI